MKTFLLSLLALTALSSFANTNDYLYMDLTGFSDDGGVTDHRYFKVKKPLTEEEETFCDFRYEIIQADEKKDKLVYSIDLGMLDASYVVTITEMANNQDMDMGAYTSADIRSKFEDLFTILSSGDGYVISGLMAGSYKQINRVQNIMYGGDQSENSYPSGKIDKAVDLTNTEYSVVIESNDEFNTKTIVNIDCMSDK